MIFQMFFLTLVIVIVRAKIDFKVLFSFLLFRHLTSFKFNISFDTRLKPIILTWETTRVYTYNTVHERFWHKLNNFSLCRFFENIFITCAEVFIIIRKLRICKFFLYCCWVWRRTLDLQQVQVKSKSVRAPPTTPMHCDLAMFKVHDNVHPCA